MGEAEGITSTVKSAMHSLCTRPHSGGLLMTTLAWRVLPLLLLLALPACGERTAGRPADGTASPGVNQGEPTAAAGTEVELGDYPLQMERVRGWARALENLHDVAEEDPQALERAEMDPDASLGETVARIEAEPQVRQAIERAGISIRDYVLTGLALFQAMFMAEAMEAGTIQSIPEGVNARNVEFVRQNRAEIERLLPQPRLVADDEPMPSHESVEEGEPEP